MGKGVRRLLSGTSDHGLALKPTSAFNGALSVAMYGDASLDTSGGYTGLVGQINGATVVWRSMWQPLDAFSTIETEAQALVDRMQMAEGMQSLLASMGLLHGVPQLCCENKSAIARAQSEGSWRAKTMVGKMRATKSHHKAKYITVYYTETTKMLDDILDEILGSESHS